MRLCDVLRTAGWLAGTLVPQQAIRALLNRDFDAAVARTDEALAVAEESVEVWEPGQSPADVAWKKIDATLSGYRDDARPDCVSRAADSPAAGERTPDNRPAAGRTFGKVERDAYFAGLTWPEPESDADDAMGPGGRFYRKPGPDRHDQIQHVAAIIRGDNLSGMDPVSTARRIVDLLAADKRIAERLDGAK